MPRFPLTLAALASLAFQAEAATDDALAACRAIKDSGARLACYDGLPLSATPRPQGAAPPAAAAAPAAAPEASRFGLPARTAPERVESVESHIAGHFEGWQAGSRIRLANGQVWQVTDGSSRFADIENPKVTVRRGALGSFFLDIDGVNPAPRVRRIE
jgi:hypothetical protein